MADDPLGGFMADDPLPDCEVDESPFGTAADEGLTLLQRFQKYAHSDYAIQRLVQVRTIPDIATSIGLEATVTHIIESNRLNNLIEDPEGKVRQAACQMLPELCRVMHALDPRGEIESRKLLYLLISSKCVTDSSTQIRKAAQNSIIELTKMQGTDQMIPIIIAVLELSDRRKSTESRTSSTLLLNRLAPVLGEELFTQYVVPHLLSLAEDQAAPVRKSVLADIANVFLFASVHEVVQRLVPAYARLASDRRAAAVRETCAARIASVVEAIASRSECCQPHVRVAKCESRMRADTSMLLHKQLTKVFKNLLNDKVASVQTAAYGQYGRMLALLPPALVSTKMVDGYAQAVLTRARWGAMQSDFTVLLNCAFVFAGIVANLGCARWAELSRAFHAMTKSYPWQVRRTLSFSLHELALVLGPTLAEKELLPVFLSFMSDLDKVREGAIQRLPDFFAVLPPDSRESCLHVFHEIMTNEPHKWRFRELLAMQLPVLCGLFSPAATYSVVFNLVYRLLSDPIETVRAHACEAVAPILARLIRHSEMPWRTNFDKMVERLVKLGRHSSCAQRMIFVGSCNASFVTMPKALFQSHFLPVLLRLAADPVSNIRLAVAQGLHKAPDWVLEAAVEGGAMRALGNDANDEVLAVARAVCWSDGSRLNASLLPPSPAAAKGPPVDLTYWRFLKGKLADDPSDPDMERAKLVKRLLNHGLPLEEELLSMDLSI